MKEYREEFTREYLGKVRQLLDSIEAELLPKVDSLINVLMKARENSNTVFLVGNGGSASTASHFAADLSKGTIVENFPRFKVIALTDNIPNILAWANDSSYEDIFIEQLKNLMSPGDVVIGISGSGNSMNVIKAIEYANEQNGVTIGLTGYDGGQLAKCVQMNIHVDSSYMQRVEDMHLIIEHLLTSAIREEQEKSKNKIGM